MEKWAIKGRIWSRAIVRGERGRLNGTSLLSLPPHHSPLHPPSPLEWTGSNYMEIVGHAASYTRYHRLTSSLPFLRFHLSESLMKTA